MTFYNLIDTATRVIKQISSVGLEPGANESVVQFELNYLLRSRQDVNTREMVIYKVTADGRETIATEQEIDALRTVKEIDGVRTYFKLNDRNEKVLATAEDVDTARVDPEREAEKHRLLLEAHNQAIRNAAQEPTQENLQEYFRTKLTVL